MPETIRYPEPAAIIEVPEVLRAKCESVEGGTLVAARLTLLNGVDVSVFVGEDQLGLLRYAGEGKGPVQPAEEHVTFIGDEKILPDDAYLLPGRQGGLRILNAMRASNMEEYLAHEKRRAESMGVSLRRVRPVKPGRVPSVERNLLVGDRLHLVVPRLPEMAVLDALYRICEPLTARRRILSHLTPELNAARLSRSA